jgi:hypothetical protein
MVTDEQVRMLMKLRQTEKRYTVAAAKAGMDPKTARKYVKLGRLPSEVKVEHNWRTREDPFDDVWDKISSQLELNHGLEAKTLFEDLQRRNPGRYSDGQLRTLQRRIKVWRALEGPSKEVYFPQEHRPGELCQSDFTHMSDLGITINRNPFRHMIYHFVLTYSNWETGAICFSESFESLSAGLQNALWELGGAPKVHQTDRLTVAVQKTANPDEFTQRYRSLLSHYGIEGRKTQAASPHENGDVEQRHYRFKRALEQSLLLRGSRDFESREEYNAFLRKLFAQLNSGRKKRFAEELEVLRRLPANRLESYKRLRVKVGPSSAIRVNHNTYSVNSRLIGELVEIRLYVEHLEVWYSQRCLEKIPRLRGENGHHINYRHIIDWLVRKPGAFENYRYRSDLFPTHRFRMAYDYLRGKSPGQASKEYLKILHLAASENETTVDNVLYQLVNQDKEITAQTVKDLIESGQQLLSPKDIVIADVDIKSYDLLLEVS